jgi:hypothetical protein
MKHVHPAGKCNKSMTSQLNKHLVSDDALDEDASEGDKSPNEATEERPVDPRWNDLKQLIDNN